MNAQLILALIVMTALFACLMLASLAMMRNTRTRQAERFVAAMVLKGLIMYAIIVYGMKLTPREELLKSSLVLIVSWLTALAALMLIAKRRGKSIGRYVSGE